MEAAEARINKYTITEGIRSRYDQRLIRQNPHQVNWGQIAQAITPGEARHCRVCFKRKVGIVSNQTLEPMRLRLGGEMFGHYNCHRYWDPIEPHQRS